MTQDALAIPAILPDDVETLQRFVRDPIEHLRKSQSRCQAVEDKLDQLLRRLYGPKGEKFNPNQPTLVDDLPCVNDADTPAVVEATPLPPVVAKPAKAGRGRREFPAGLRRETITQDLAEAEKVCPCCSMMRAKIGEEVTEKLDGVPATLFVVRHVRPKYGCAKCLKAKAGTVDRIDDTPSVIAIAPPAPHVIPKCSAEPGLLAQIIVNKFTDHLPLARQEAIFARQGIRISRQTMCNWLADCAKALTPLYKSMLARVLQSRVIHCDETRVAVQELLALRAVKPTQQLIEFVFDGLAAGLRFAEVFDQIADETLQRLDIVGQDCGDVRHGGRHTPSDARRAGFFHAKC